VVIPNKSIIGLLLSYLARSIIAIKA